MNSQDKDVLKAIIEICASNQKAYLKIDQIISTVPQIKEERIRKNIFQITGLNPNVFTDTDLVEMIKDVAELIISIRERPKTYAVNFKFILFKKSSFARLEVSSLLKRK